MLRFSCNSSLSSKETETGPHTDLETWNGDLEQLYWNPMFRPGNLEW